MEVVGFCMFFSVLFSMLVFDILQIYDVSIEICIGSNAVTCTPLIQAWLQLSDAHTTRTVIL